MKRGLSKGSKSKTLSITNAVLLYQKIIKFDSELLILRHYLMNKFITAITNLDFLSVSALLEKDSKWVRWSEKDGKNALHFLCAVPVAKTLAKSEASLQILKLLLKKGMDINSVHKISEKNGFFPATPLWYGYTRGRNERLFKYLLKNGADPNHCMFAIAWYDDPTAATLFKKHGAQITDAAGKDTPFLAAFHWGKKMTEWFLKNGADVNFTDEYGNTALFYAVKRKRELTWIKLLLKFGADINKENKEGLSPKKLAERSRQKSILKFIG